jgi:DNA invertase Pin-like site-specific DNA recombinase
VLVLAEWDRATRSLMDGIRIMERVHHSGAFIKVLDRPGLDLTTPSGRGILALLSGLAEEVRTRIHRRANEGRVAAIKRGVKLGRKIKLSDSAAGRGPRAPGQGRDLPGHREDDGLSHATVARLAR